MDAVEAKSVAQVILRWHIQRNIVVIPKSVKRENGREFLGLRFRTDQRGYECDKGPRYEDHCFLRSSRPCMGGELEHAQTRYLITRMGRQWRRTPGTVS